MLDTKPQVYLRSQPPVVFMGEQLHDNVKMNQEQTIQERILLRMKIFNLKNVDLANAAGVSEQAVGRKWLGLGKIAKKHLPTLAALLKTTVDWLLTGEGSPDANDEEHEWIEMFRQLTADQKRTMKEVMGAIAKSNDPKCPTGEG